MSLQALNWAFRIEAMASPKKFVLVALANYASETGMAYPSVATICRLTCQQDATVRRALDNLVSDKVIEDTGKRVGATHQVKVYKLPPEACESPTDSGGLKDPQKTHEKTLRRPTKTGGNPVTSTPEPENTHPADAGKGSDFKADTASDAEIFAQAVTVYDLYPRKVGKPRALKKIAKQIKAHGIQHVRTRTEAFAAAWAGGDLTYCPHPATWFEQERFNDAPETWVSSGQTKQPAKTAGPKQHGPGDWE